jgi:protoporphyrin/coproporphyrin ferrochelatase
VTVGVLVMAYGTPASPDDVESYYTHIRRGRPPTAEQLADLKRRYDAIGGISPLLQITRQQCARLATALGDGYVVALGQKHASPFIEDGVAELADAGVDSIVGLVLAPHYSAYSIGQYADRVQSAATARGLAASTVESWNLMPAYLSFLDRAVQKALSTLPPGAEVVFTAHSLPQRITETGDPYPVQVRETAETVATRRSLDRWSTAWQSAGRTPEPWLGPDILDVIRGRALAGSPGLVVCACGFTADHLEVLYDLDIEASALAGSLDLPFARTASINDDEAVFAGLADVVRREASTL